MNAMKKTTILLSALILILLLCACSNANNSPSAATSSVATAAPMPTIESAPGASTPTPEPTPSAKPVSPEVQGLEAQNKKVWSEMHDREYMEGRLVIPSAGIDVALFSWGTEPAGDYDRDKVIELVRQSVVDNADSALLYNDDPVGNIIADHSTQDFSALSNVKEGDKAYILSGDRIVTLTCDFATDGVNTGYGITDKGGGWNHKGTDYVCYTCMEDWTHILIVGFKMTDEDFFDMAWIDVSEASADKGVVTTKSLPASNVDAPAAPAATTAPAVTAAPTETPKPTEAPAQQPAQQAPAEPVYYDYDYTVPGYDIYADNNYYGGPVNNLGDYGYTGIDSGDGYLG